MDENKKYENAKKRVEEIKSFYTHLFVYIVVNVGLLLINIITLPGSLWFLWVLIGWGIGLAVHAFNVFGTEKILGKDWEEKKIKEIMEKDKSKAMK